LSRSEQSDYDAVNSEINGFPASETGNTHITGGELVDFYNKDLLHRGLQVGFTVHLFLCRFGNILIKLASLNHQQLQL
jgi:hypothetical protein